MSRRTDLEQHIRDSYALICEYEAIILTSAEPKEKARSRRAIEELWLLIEDYLAEYKRLSSDSWPEDIAQIRARFAMQDSQPESITPATPPVRQGRVTFVNHIEHAQAIAIGDGAQVSSRLQNIRAHRSGRLSCQEQRRRELQAEWDDLSARIEALRHDLGLEMDRERELVLRRRLEDLETRRGQIEVHLDTIEQ